MPAGPVASESKNVSHPVSRDVGATATSPRGSQADAGSWAPQGPPARETQPWLPSRAPCNGDPAAPSGGEETWKSEVRVCRSWFANRVVVLHVELQLSQPVAGTSPSLCPWTGRCSSHQPLAELWAPAQGARRLRSRLACRAFPSLLCLLRVSPAHCTGINPHQSLSMPLRGTLPPPNPALTFGLSSVSLGRRSVCGGWPDGAPRKTVT